MDLTQNFFLKLSPNSNFLKNTQSSSDSMRKNFVAIKKQSTLGKKEAASKLPKLIFSGQLARRRKPFTATWNHFLSKHRLQLLLKDLTKLRKKKKSNLTQSSKRK